MEAFGGCDRDLGSKRHPRINGADLAVTHSTGAIEPEEATSWSQAFLLPELTLNSLTLTPCRPFLFISLVYIFSSKLFPYKGKDQNNMSWIEELSSGTNLVIFMNKML